MDNLPKVSFIIPTLNASKFLPACLKAIKSQNYPKDKIEIIVADGGSTDSTRQIARKYNARIIDNPEVLHEPGKARASSVATGKIFFFTDSDNELSNTNWVKDMTKPYIENPNLNIEGFLAQTIPPKNWNSFDRYMGYLGTDPFTWFIYRSAANPQTWGKSYKPIKSTNKYKIYKFEVKNHPLLGLSQGFGTISSFKREKLGHSDDIISGIKLIAEGGLIAYVPTAGIYHYHVSDMSEFLRKYTWRIRNNLNQKIKGMGLINRQQYLNRSRKLRQVIFPLYSLTIILPLIDSLILFRKYKDPVVFWHVIGCLILTFLIIKEIIIFAVGIRITPGKYG